MFEFRRRQSDAKWHLCQNCSEWPTSDFEVCYGKLVPESDEVCWECHGRDKCGDCDLKVVEKEQP